MKFFVIAIALLSITSCQSMNSTDPNSMFFSIPENSTLSLNKTLTIPQSDTHAVVQDGEEITDKDRNDYAINCRLDVREFGPRTIDPETFNITRTEDGQNWISQPSILRYYTEVYLSSEKNTDIIKMVCQVYSDSLGRNFTVAEMQQTLGDFFTFNYPTAEPDK